MRLKKSDSIGLIIDIQEKLIPAMHNGSKLIENNHILVQGLNILEISVFHTQQYTKGLGNTVEHINSLMLDDPYEKITFSCCSADDVMDKIMFLGKKNIVIGGIEAHVCVMQTAIDLKSLGYNPVVIDDCITSRDPYQKEIAMKRMIQEGVAVSTYESVLFELCGMAGTDEFKKISKLLK